MRPFFGRVGGKTKIRDKIISLFPEHKIYVEAFVGGGSVLFGKKPSEVEVINDKDKDIASMYRDIKKLKATTIGKFNFVPSKERFDNYLRSSPTTPAKRLERNLYLNINSFGGNNKTYCANVKHRNPNTKGAHIKKNSSKYRERLADVKVYSYNFTTVIKKFDGPSTFFYLDPPYSKMDKSWGYAHLVTPQQVYAAVKKIKGKFLLSYDDSPIVRQTFKDYTIREIGQVYNLALNDKTQKVGELLISNY